MKQYGLAHHATDRITFDTLDIGQDISEFLRDDRFSQGFTKIFSFYVMNWVTDLEWVFLFYFFKDNPILSSAQWTIIDRTKELSGTVRGEIDW